MIWGIDIGGTNIKVGLFQEANLIYHDSFTTNTKDNGAFILKEVRDFIFNYHYFKDYPLTNIKGFGFGVPGPVKNNYIIRCPNIGWESKDLIKEFKELTNLEVPIIVANDANAAALGEYHKSNLKEDILFITLGTGVGGGIIIDGEILEGVHGSAAELGHLKVEYDEPLLCSCGLRGCLETIGGIKGLTLLARKLYSIRTLPTKLKEDDLWPVEVFNYAKKGDQLALAIIRKYADYLARGIASFTVAIDPEVIIVGGGISNAGEILIKKLKEAYLDYAYYAVKDVRFQLAELGNRAGIYGCYYLVKKHVG
ncbi:MAG: ROK family protein [Acholeplasmataceae bacterium]